MTIRSLFVENLPVKVISLLVACFLWFYVTSQEEERQKILVPIELTNLPDSLTFLDDIPDQAEIIVRASRKDLLWLRLFQKISMGINLAQAEEGRLTVALSTKNLVLPRNIPPQAVSIQSPTGLTFHFDRLVTRRIPVRLIEQGEPPEGFVKVGESRVAPATVLVTGPSRRMERLEFIDTEPLDVSKRKSDFDKDIRLLLDPKVFRCEPDEVQVAYRIEPIVEKTLEDLVPVFVRDSDDLMIDFAPPSGSVTLKGPRSRLDTLESGNVDMTVVLGGLKAGTYRLPVQFSVPEGVEIQEASPDSFSVTLRKPES